jgi:hypothetical protein
MSKKAPQVGAFFVREKLNEEKDRLLSIKHVRRVLLKKPTPGAPTRDDTQILFVNERKAKKSCLGAPFEPSLWHGCLSDIRHIANVHGALGAFGTMRFFIIDQSMSLLKMFFFANAKEL